MEIAKSVSQNGRIRRCRDGGCRLKADTQILKPSGGCRPVPVIDAREHLMTALDHSADVRFTRERSFPSGRADIAAAPDTRARATALEKVDAKFGQEVP